MSTYVSLIGYAPLGIPAFVQKGLADALRANHLGHLDLFEPPTSAATPTRLTPRPALQRLHIDEDIAALLLRNAGIVATSPAAGGYWPRAIARFFEVNLRMQLDPATGVPSAAGEFHEICRELAALIPGVHVWYGALGAEYGEHVHLRSQDIQRLAHLPWRATGPGTPEGDATLGLGELLVLSASALPPGARPR